MQIETLKIYCDVARLRSFSLCAEQNEITQSTVSQAVQGLEEHLGVTLIDRSQRPWKLTSEGEIFQHGCQDILHRYEDLEKEVKHSLEEKQSVVRMVSIYSVGLRHMSDYVKKFSLLSPQTEVQLEYAHPDKVYESVLNEKADLGIVSFPYARRDLSVIPWRHEDMVMACPPDHPLGVKKEIELSRINQEKFVTFDKQLIIRKEINRFLRDHKIDVDVSLEFDNIEAIKRAVEAGSGISILPRPTLDHEVKSGILKAIPFKTINFKRPLGIIYRRGKHFTLSMNRFVELLQGVESS